MAEAVNLEKAFDDLASALVNDRRRGHASFVITSASVLDYQLERAIKTKMVKLNSRMEQRLFGGYGPLSTFAAKNDFAFALGIVSLDMHREANKIRDIRNKFAHTRKILSLETEPILSLFNKLKRPPMRGRNYAEAFLGCILEISDAIERYLVSQGVTEDISERNMPSAPTP